MSPNTEGTRLRIGQFLVERGLLKSEEVSQILEYSERTRARFGDSAIELGLLDRERLSEVFGPSFRVDYFHLDPRYFPRATRDAVPLADILKHGALPLGFGHERGGLGDLFRSHPVLNIGLVDPGDGSVADEVERRAGMPVRVYLVLPDSFLAVLAEVYELPSSRLRQMGSELHPLLARLAGVAEKGSEHAGA